MKTFISEFYTIPDLYIDPCTIMPITTMDRYLLNFPADLTSALLKYVQFSA